MTQTKQKMYQNLLDRMHEISLIASAAEVLNWDQETYMPARAVTFRADQLAHLTGLSHRLFTALEVGQWISECEQSEMDPEGPAAANIREWRRSYNRQTRLPSSLVEELERECSLAREAWVEAKKRSEFGVFKPHLEKIVDLNRRMADLWGWKESPYNALLEEYEPGMSVCRLETLFQTLGTSLKDLLGTAIEQSRRIPAGFLEADYPVENQKAFNREVAEAMGFDFTSGRIDTTEHPFCTTLGPRDCRLTTRYDVRNFTDSLFSVLHEAGHGLYEQGLEESFFGTPCGSYASLGVHESQSRLWENHVGRSEAFWEHWHPRACHYFPHLKRFSPRQIAVAVNRVQPSLIRVDADQATYDSHIILRFDLERRLIEGRLAVADVPAAWNERFKELLGLEVPDDARGCLQDVHWSLGSFGYFPTYTLGNLNAAQLMSKAQSDIEGLNNFLRQGNYAPLLGWLREKIHRHGKRYLPADLIAKATGEAPGVAAHLRYLRDRLSLLKQPD